MLYKGSKKNVVPDFRNSQISLIYALRNLVRYTSISDFSLFLVAESMFDNSKLFGRFVRDTFTDLQVSFC